MTHFLSKRRDKNTRIVTAVLATLALVGTLLVPGAVATAAGECGVNSNPIVCENSKPGTDPSVWDIDGAGDPDLQGFSTDISVNVGSRVDFKIDTDAASYSIDIYRTGYYGGAGARKVDSVTPVPPPPAGQPPCVTVASTQI